MIGQSQTFILIIYFGTFPYIWSQVVSMGSCPIVQAVKAFDMDRYSGRWYEVERYPFLLEAFGRCTTVDFTLKDKRLISNTRITRPLTGFVISVDAKSTMIYPDDSGVLSVVYPIIAWSGGWPSRIVETDYVRYSVLWSCVDILGLVNLQVSWILTRSQFPPEEALDMAVLALDSQSISTAPLGRVSQEDCPKNNDKIDLHI